MARICTGAAFGSPRSSAGQLDQPSPADHRVHEPGRDRGQREQRQHGRRRVVHPEDRRLTPCGSCRCCPSTTEILFAIGAGDDVVGVTFECDTPAEARTRTIVSTSAMPEGLSPAEIDAYVADAVARGEDLYRLVSRRPARPRRGPGGDPGPVCGLRRRRDHRGRRAGPPRLPGRGADRRPAHPRRGPRLGAACSARPPAGPRRRSPWSTACARGSTRCPRQVAGRPRPRVAVLEWTDPPYAPGHWIPEMVELAGGECVLGTAGAKSVRITWDDLHAARPGRGRRGALRLRPGRRPGPGRRRSSRAGLLPAGVAVHAVDADGMWARPGPRLVDGIEELAEILQPA